MPGAYCGDGLQINVRKRLDERLGMAEWQTCKFLCHVADVIISAPENFRRFTLGDELQFVRMLLLPRERAFRAVNADVQVVFLAAGNLRAMQNPFRTTLVAQQQVCIILQFAARNERCEFRAQRINLQARDVAAEIFRVRADVPEAAGRARLLDRLLRQAACFWPSASMRSSSQPCGYSATTFKIFPSLPLRTSSRASLTIG